MVLKALLQHPETIPQNEIKQASSLLSRIRLTMDTSPLGANFRRYGSSFGTYDYDAFIALAKKFFTDGKHSSDPLYSVVEMADGRIAVDYNGEVRGIFTAKGKPLAFFRPDYTQAGFQSKHEEILAFQSDFSRL